MTDVKIPALPLGTLAPDDLLEFVDVSDTSESPEGSSKHLVWAPEWKRTGINVSFQNDGDVLNLSTAGPTIDSISSVFNVVAVTGITPINDSTMIVQSSTAGDTNITANPQIVAGTTGQRLLLVGSDNTKTVTFDTGTGLILDNGQSFTMGANDILELIFVNSLWTEISRKDNA